MSDYLPEDILRKILLTLPIKTLIKATLVCKTWKSFIESSAFIHSHLRTTIYTNDKHDSHLLLLSATRDDATRRESRHWRWNPSEFGEHSMLPNVSDIAVVGTCNGLVCLTEDQLLERHRAPIMIRNPSIRKTVMLPEPPMEFIDIPWAEVIHGFGYDSVSDDYNIVRVVGNPHDHSDLSRFKTVVQVYSLARGSWKSLSAWVTPVDWQGRAVGYVKPLFINGIFHTVQARFSVYYNDPEKEHRKCSGEDKFIGTFDLATEVFGEIMIPEALQGYQCFMSKIWGLACFDKVSLWL